MSQKVGFACVQALGTTESNEAISQLARLRAKVKYTVALKLIEKCLHEAANRSLRSAAETLSVIERQRIVRLLVKDVLLGEDTITIRHSIPIPSGPPQSGGSESPDGQNYLLCKGRG